MTRRPPGVALATLNPYSPTAVARVVRAEGEPAGVTVQTAAIDEAIGHLSAYLDGPGRAAGEPGTDQLGPGNVLAVVGDYGTGKTHLAVRLLEYADSRHDKSPHTVYVDAQPDDFVELYKHFVGKLQLADILGRVREFYLDVVVDYLRDDQVTHQIAEMLSSRPDLDVHAVVTEMGLDDTALLPPLRAKLENVTGNPSLIAALLLLLRPGFEKPVWEWFGGAPPAEILLERGIEVQLDTEDLALEAMGVIALLHGRNNHRLILVVDELEKVLSGARAVEASVAPFKKMLTMFGEARAFLVLAGLPDFLHVLPPDTLDRIGPIIHMPPLTAEQTRELLLETQRAAGLPGLAPFTEESVDYLRELAEGIPRKIIRLCFHVYRRAVEGGVPVSIELVRDVARGQTTVLGVDDIRKRVRTILGAEGLIHSARYQLDNTPLTRVDEWVHVGGGPTDGFGILVTGSVLTDADVVALQDKALAIQAARAGAQVLLIVNGYIPVPSADRLGGVFNQQPLAYDARTFDNDVTETVRAMVIRNRGEVLAAGSPGEETEQVVNAVRDPMAQVSRQQTSLYLFIEQLGSRLDMLRESTERRFEAVQGELGDISGALATGQQAGAPAVSAPGRLPPVVGRLFTAALDTLAGLRQVDIALRQIFTASVRGDVSGYRRSLSQVRSSLRAGRVVSSAGALVLVQRLVTTFQESVAEWYRSLGSRLRPADEEQLKALCSAYDAVYEYLPIYEISGLSEFADSYAAAPELDRRSWSVLEVQEALDGLGARVQRTMLEALSA
jgi:hypothetical protein